MAADELPPDDDDLAIGAVGQELVSCQAVNGGRAMDGGRQAAALRSAENAMSRLRVCRAGAGLLPTRTAADELPPYDDDLAIGAVGQELVSCPPERRQTSCRPTGRGAARARDRSACRGWWPDVTPVNRPGCPAAARRGASARRQAARCPS